MGRKRRSRRNVKNIPENEEESNDVHLSFQGVSDSESPCQFNLRTLQWTENKVTKDQDFKLIETKTFVSYVRKIQANLLEECSQDPNSSLLVTIPLSLVNLKQHRDFGNQSLKFVQKSSEVQTLNIAQSSCLSKDLSLSESSEDEQMLNENLLHLNLTPKQLSVFVEDVKTKSKTCEVLPINSESSESDKTIKYASFRCLDNNAELENMCQFSNLTNTENSNSDSTILLKENYDYIPNILQGQIMNDNVIKESGTVEFPKIVEKLLRKPQGLLESQIFPKCFKQYDEGYQEEIVSEHSSEISHSSWDGVIPIDSEILNNAPDEILLDFNLSNFDMDKCDSGVRKGLIKENEDLAIGEWPLKVNENINCPTDNVAFIRSDDLLNEELDFEPDFEAENFSGFSTDSFKECESLTTQIPSKSDERNQADVTSTNSSVKGINHETEKKCAAKRPFSEAFTNSPVNNCSDELVTDNKSSPTRLPMETVSSEKVCASKLPKNNSTDTLLKNVYYLKDQNTKSNRPTKVKWERNFLLKNSIKHKKKKLSPVKSDHKVPFSRVKSATSDELELQPSIADLLDEEFISSPIQNRVISVAKHKENETNIASFQKADAPDNDPSKLGNSHKYDEPGKVVDLMTVVIQLVSKGFFTKALDEIKKVLKSNRHQIGDSLYHVILNASKIKFTEIIIRATEVYLKLPLSVSVSNQLHEKIMSKIIYSIKESKNVSKSTLECVKNIFFLARRNKIKLITPTCYSILDFYFTSQPLDWRFILDVLHFSIGFCKNRPSFKHLNALLEISPSIPQMCNSIVNLIKKIDAKLYFFLKKDHLSVFYDTLIHYRNDKAYYISDLMCKVFPETPTETSGIDLNLESTISLPTQQVPSQNKHQYFLPESLQNVTLNIAVERWTDIGVLFSDYGIEFNDHNIIQNIHNCLKNCRARAGYCYKKLLNAIAWRPLGSQVFNSQIAFLGQMGVSLMMELHLGKYYFSAVEVLESMHSFNINYYALQKAINFSELIQLGYFQMSMLKTANQVAYVAVDTCIKVGYLRYAIQVLSDCDWMPISKEDLDSITVQEEGQKMDIFLSLFRLILNEISSSNESLDNKLLYVRGIQVVEELLKMIEDKKQSSYEKFWEFEELVHRFFTILLNRELLDECSRLITFIRNLGTIWFDLAPSHLRGYFVLKKRNGDNMISFFENLSFEGIYVKSYVISKTILVNSFLTIEELQTAIEENLLKYKNFIFRSREHVFEQKYGLQIKIKLGTFKNPEKVNILSVSSDLKECYSRIVHVLARLRPPLELCENESSSLIDKSIIYLKPYTVYVYMHENFQLTDNSFLGDSLLPTPPIENKLFDWNLNLSRIVSNTITTNSSSVRVFQNLNSRFSNISEAKSQEYVSEAKSSKLLSVDKNQNSVTEYYNQKSVVEGNKLKPVTENVNSKFVLRGTSSSSDIKKLHQEFFAEDVKNKSVAEANNYKSVTEDINLKWFSVDRNQISVAENIPQKSAQNIQQKFVAEVINQKSVEKVIKQKSAVLEGTSNTSDGHSSTQIVHLPSSHNVNLKSSKINIGNTTAASLSVITLLDAKPHQKSVVEGSIKKLVLGGTLSSSDSDSLSETVHLPTSHEPSFKRFKINRSNPIVDCVSLTMPPDAKTHQKSVAEDSNQKCILVDRVQKSSEDVKHKSFTQDINEQQQKSVARNIQQESVEEGIQQESVEEGIQQESVEEGIQHESVEEGIQHESVEEGINKKIVLRGTSSTSDSHPQTQTVHQPSSCKANLKLFKMNKSNLTAVCLPVITPPNFKPQFQEKPAALKFPVVSKAVTYKIEQFLLIQIKKLNKPSNCKELAQVFIQQVTTKLQISHLVLSPAILRELNIFSKTI